MQSVVIALFPNSDQASQGLNNLSEAGFGPPAISLVMRRPEDVDALADASGPLNKLPLDQLPERLHSLGLPEKDALSYRDGVLRGGVFIAVSTPRGSEAAAQEILADADATSIRLLTFS